MTLYSNCVILKTKKIGHTGMLIPSCTGVLPVCIGNEPELVIMLWIWAKLMKQLYR